MGKELLSSPKIPLFIAALGYLALYFASGVAYNVWQVLVYVFFALFLLCTAWFFIGFYLLVRKKEPLIRSLKLLAMYFVLALLVMIQGVPAHRGAVENPVQPESPDGEAYQVIVLPEISLDDEDAR